MSRPKLNNNIVIQAKETIIKGLAIGESLASIVKDFETVSMSTVYHWLNENHADHDAEFLQDYVRAREQQAEFYADEVIEIADKATDLNRARLQIDARKWKAGKMKPKVYGDRLITENTTTNKNVEMTKEEMEAELKDIKKRLS